MRKNTHKVKSYKFVCKVSPQCTLYLLKHTQNTQCTKYSLTHTHTHTHTILARTHKFQNIFKISYTVTHFDTHIDTHLHAPVHTQIWLSTFTNVMNCRHWYWYYSIVYPLHSYEFVLYLCLVRMYYVCSNVFYVCMQTKYNSRNGQYNWIELNWIENPSGGIFIVYSNTPRELFHTYCTPS